MTLHLIKLAAGADSLDDLQARVVAGVARSRKRGRGALHEHITRMAPRRADELLDGGSLYWVVRGAVLVRQEIASVERVAGADGVGRCAIMLTPQLIATEPQPRRAFQGWRYLRPEDAPRDIRGERRRETAALHAKLAELGLL